MKHLVLISLLITVVFGCQKEESSEKHCSCYKLAEPQQAQLALTMANITGAVKLNPPPLGKIESRVFVYIDEKHIFSDERHRMMEQEIEIAYEHDDIGTCGNSDLDEAVYVKEYSEDAYSESCDCGYSLSSYAEEERYNKPTRVSAVARAELDTYDSIRLELNFDYPDYRSQYFIGIHIDLNGDGKITEGDYFTKEFVELDLTGSTQLKLTADKIETQKTVAKGSLNLNGLPTPPAEAMIKVVLFDISVAKEPRKIADITKHSSPDLTFALSALPETNNAFWQITAWIDINLNGKLDQCDYVEESSQTWYSLADLSALSIPLAYAGGSTEECEAVELPPVEVEEEEEEEGLPVE